MQRAEQDVAPRAWLILLATALASAILFPAPGNAQRGPSTIAPGVSDRGAVAAAQIASPTPAAATPTSTPTATAVPGTATAIATWTPVPGTPPAATTPCVLRFRSSDVPRAIPDPGVVTSTITISHEVTISNLEVVGMAFTHYVPGDLSVRLISPSGTRVWLFRDVCRGPNPWMIATTGFSLSDAAIPVMGSACPPGSAAYRPQEPLAAFSGESAAGIWRLEVSDDLSRDAGSLESWGLRIEGACSGTPAPCPVEFSDVPPDHVFSPYIHCLACHGVIGGYSDGTFRPQNSVTRAQAAKIVAGAAGLADDIPPGRQSFKDVPREDPFWIFVERATLHGVVGGYDREIDCGAGQAPCFRPYRELTRGQLAKIVAGAAGFREDHTGQAFQDLPLGHPFHVFVERLASRGIISGYSCGTPGVPPCEPGNRPYFLWANAVTRGQTAKIVAHAFFPGCEPALKQ